MGQKKNKKRGLKQLFLRNSKTGQTVLLGNSPIKDTYGMTEVTTLQVFEDNLESEMSVYQSREDFDKFVTILKALFGWETIRESQLSDSQVLYAREHLQTKASRKALWDRERDELIETLSRSLGTRGGRGCKCPCGNAARCNQNRDWLDRL